MKETDELTNGINATNIIVCVNNANRSEKKLRMITGTIRSGTARALTEVKFSNSNARTTPEVKVNM